MKANKKVMAALLAAMMTVSAGAAVVSAADVAVSGPGSSWGNPMGGNGWYKTDNNYYYYKTGVGTYASGWKKDTNGKWYYLAYMGSDGNLYTDGFKVGDMSTGYNGDLKVANSSETTTPHYAIVDNVAYIKCAGDQVYQFRFDKNGEMVTGWYQVPDTTANDPTGSTVAGNWEYYDRTTGARKLGWYKDYDNWYYTVKGDVDVYKINSDGTKTAVPMSDVGKLLMDGTYEINGVRYTFAKNGVMLNQGQGWTKENGKWHFITKDGYFRGVNMGADANNNIIWTYSSWLLDKGKYYLFNNSGEMLTGWHKVATDGNGTKAAWYYMDQNGALVMNNWIKTGNDWYLVNASGEMQVGWVVRNGKTYLLNDATVTGLTNIHYGAMVTGTRVPVGGGAYATFDASGALVSLVNEAGDPVNVPN